MKKALKTPLIYLFIIFLAQPFFGQENREPTVLGKDVLFTVSQDTKSKKKRIDFLKKKDGSEITVDEYMQYSFQDTLSKGENFDYLPLKPGYYTIDNMIQTGEFIRGNFFEGNFQVFLYPVIANIEIDEYIKSITFYNKAEGNENGQSEEYRRDGSLFGKGQKDGMGYKTGPWEHFDENGNLVLTGDYESGTGNRVGIWKRYDSNGKILSEADFDEQDPTNPFTGN